MNRSLKEGEVDELKTRADIYSIVSSYVNLKRTGKNFVGLCPFHKEKTPSFTVDPIKQFYHCFGCGEGGDVISFIMKIENMQFLEAVEFLAKICQNEGIKFTKEALEEVFTITEGDLRRALNLLQSASTLKKDLTPEVVREVAGLVAGNFMVDVINTLLKDGYSAARRKMFESMAVLGLSGTDVLRLAIEALDSMGKMNPKLAELIAEFDFRLVEGGNEDIQLSAFLAALHGVLKG